MAEEQLAELQSRYDAERHTNKQLENKKTELAREFVSLSVCLSVWVCACVHVCVSVSAYVYVCLHLCLSVLACVCVFVSVCACVCVCVCRSNWMC